MWHHELGTSKAQMTNFLGSKLLQKARNWPSPLSYLFNLLTNIGYNLHFVDSQEISLELAKHLQSEQWITENGWLVSRMENNLLSNWCFFLFSIDEQIEEGLNLLVGILQNPALQRSSKVWYLLRASALQLTAAYLILPSSILPLTLRQKLSVQGECENLCSLFSFICNMLHTL